MKFTFGLMLLQNWKIFFFLFTQIDNSRRKILSNLVVLLRKAVIKSPFTTKLTNRVFTIMEYLTGVLFRHY